MTIFRTLVVCLFFVISRGVYAKDDLKAMVAFICNKPAMYHTPDGWKSDSKTDCLHKPSDILNYCRKVYPQLDVTNIMESSENIVIKNWCNFVGKCHPKHHDHTVRPYRCLVGPFQSDPLLVPKHCVFDHIEDEQKCQGYDDWNRTATETCATRAMVRQSFAPLRPCRTARFDGVEFVCCPGKKDAGLDYFKEKREQLESRKSHPSMVVHSTWEEQKKQVKSSEEDEVDDAPDVLDEKHGAYFEYIHKNGDMKTSEHEMYLKAKKDLASHQHNKVTKMMKEWSAARQRVHDMKDSDPKGADKLNQEITVRFQKTYEALEQEGLAEKEQLHAIHVQHVEARSNLRKRHAMQRYMHTLAAPKPNPSNILHALKHYLSVEEKDRTGSVRRYEHVRDTASASEADNLRERTITHLKVIQERIEQAIAMLTRVPDLEHQIHLQVEDFMKTFHKVDDDVKRIMSETSRTQFNDKMLRKYKQEIQEIQTKDTKQPIAPIVLHHVPLHVITPVIHAAEIDPKRTDEDEEEEDDDEGIEDEHDMPDESPVLLIKQPVHMASVQSSALKMEDEQYIKQSFVKGVNDMHIGSTVGIAVGSVTVFVVLVIGVMVMRRRHTPASRGFVEVAQNASMEERHVSKMQMNGYENPTYKFFEKSNVKA